MKSYIAYNLNFFFFYPSQMESLTPLGSLGTHANSTAVLNDFSLVVMIDI